MVWDSPKVAMPWVGLYVSVASFICTFAMAADVVQAIWQRKLWFPNKFFTLNASTITLIAIAMKLPTDLTTNKCEGTKVPIELCDPKVYFEPDGIDITKMSGISFLVTMLANFLPSLGLMGDKELLMNIVALGILVITVFVNIVIQMFTERYRESQRLVSSHQEKVFSSKGLKNYVKKYWMMTETRNPQFVIAYSPVSSAFGVICLYLSFISGVGLVDLLKINEIKVFNISDYKWSLKIIFIVQSIGVVVGSVAPVFRCFTAIGHYNLSKEWSKNHLNVFRVEKIWIQRLQQWKCNYIHSHIPGRRCKIVFHCVKNTFLNFCIALHILVLVICKTICLLPRTSLILLSYCCYFCASLLKRFTRVSNMPNSGVTSETEEYAMYVVQIDEAEKLSNRILRNTLHYITNFLVASEEKVPRNLTMLLEKSTGFTGVTEFNNDRVQALYPEEIYNCWSLVVVTLASTAIALPNISNVRLKGLLASISEGLLIVRHIEECLNTDGDMVKSSKAARRVWTEVEIYRSWLKIDLQKKAHKGKTSKEILKWLGDEAENIVKEFMSGRSSSIDESPYKFILASTMYRISRTILLRCDEQD
ncbi:hypothetical protein HanXRQr2_Chr11g0517361 [Helianthus annuus]|uniref:Uncharacterized protein n=1 Tax=Helianthus annuus TaxID=4232 RepID=A0A251TF73_HELAN|nr:hypothetical protein HanXRQr2_Chr11g0517361 [Helianthus annuus]KAJ0503462.1 hypothetical protein HanHA300_Chr11g0424501 [Helianthus annuus]KAJ0519417.1 hypothetical protein HanHA89_Chr11g0448521 [Helianthus annuus]KAJ0691206.1 hypothetical protein HanOQP8_Chr11g0426491 [Helianthus annuus]